MENEFDLSIAESFLFILHHPSKSQFRGNEVHLSISLRAAILLDLLQKGAITIQNAEVQPTGKKVDLNEVEKKVLDVLNSSRKLRKTRYWLQHLFSKAKIKKWDIWRPMVRKGLVGLERKKFLGFIPYHVSKMNRTLVQSSMIRELRIAIQQPQKDKKRELFLLALIHSSDAYRVFSDSWRERQEVRKKIKALVKNEPVLQEMEKLIKDIQSAATVAMMSSTSATVATR
jgi:hypothetical protein